MPRVDASGREWTRVDASGREWTRVKKSKRLRMNSAFHPRPFSRAFARLEEILQPELDLRADPLDALRERCATGRRGAPQRETTAAVLREPDCRRETRRLHRIDEPAEIL